MKLHQKNHSFFSFKTVMQLIITNVPSKSLISVRGMKGRVSNGGYSNLGTRSKDFISDLPILFPKSRCLLKKRSSL